MEQIRKFFSMSRHERRGAIVVIALLAIVLGGRFMCSRMGDAPASVDEGAMQQFVQRTDSLKAVRDSMVSEKKTEKNKHKKSSDKKRQGNKSQSKKKTPPAERKLAPVPGF